MKIEQLRQQLAIQQARYKIAIGNEAKTGRVTAQASKIGADIERLTRAIEAAELEEEPSGNATFEPIAPTINDGASVLKSGGWSHGEIARATGKTRSASQLWRGGKKTPDQASRVKLSEPPYSIPIGAWDAYTPPGTVAQVDAGEQPEQGPILDPIGVLRSSVATLESLMVIAVKQNNGPLAARLQAVINQTLSTLDRITPPPPPDPEAWPDMIAASARGIAQLRSYVEQIRLGKSKGREPPRPFNGVSTCSSTEETLTRPGTP